MKNGRTLKRVLSLLLCVLMFATLLPSFSFADLPAPVLGTAAADGNGITVNWSAVTGADSYRVYRKTASTKWITLGETAGTSFHDSTAAAGTTYTYTVRCLVSGSVNGPYDAIGVSGAWTEATAGWVGTPKLVSATASKTEITVKWNEVSGAAGYRVYRKTSSTGWSTLADVGLTDNYSDTSAVPGTEYIYTVRCLNGSSEVCSNYNTTGVKAKIDKAEAAKLDTPVLVGASAEGSGLRVSWNAVSGAAAYRVYRKTASTSWARLVDVSGTDYLDNTAKAGTKYTYTVRCLNASNAVCSDYNTTGVSGTWTSGNTGTLTTPVLVSAVCSGDAVLFKWNLVTGADGYRVYRKTGNGGWVALADVGSSEDSYLDASVLNDRTYTYTVRCLSSGNVASGYNTAGKSIHFYSVPVLNEAISSGDGILVKWAAVSGAPRYLVYRKVGISGTYARLGITTNNYFQDNAANPGTDYYYTVRVFSTDGKTFLSDFDHTGINGVYIGKVQVKTLTNSETGVLIEWDAVGGVATYVLERKTAGGEFINIGTSTSTSFVDTTAVSNTEYTYRIRGLDSSDVPVGSYDEVGKSIKFYATPKLVSAEQQNKGVVVTWEKVEGLTYFNIYRKINAGTWMTLARGVTGTSYVDTTVVSGVDATYTVRGVAADGTVLSDYDHTGVTCHSIVFYTAPVLESAESSIGGILFSWQEVDGAPKYRVFRKDNTATSWTPVADVTTLFYLDDDIPNGGDVKDGGTYTYTVACLNSSDELASEYNATGLTATYYTVPAMISAQNETGGVKITWEPANGISTYAVFRKTASDSWIQIAAGVNNAAYIDSTAQSAGHYFYAVASMINGKVVSAHEVPGVETVFYAAPSNITAQNVETGVKVKWDAVDGINDYRVYRRDNNLGGFTTLGDVSGTTEFVDTTAVSNNTYTYTVRCLDGSTVVSDYDKSGRTILYVAAPELVGATGGNKSVAVQWKSVDGATGYDVYRKTGVNGWTRIAHLIGGNVNNYTDTGLNASYTYTYTVVAFNNDWRSGYDSTGVSATTN